MHLCGQRRRLRTVGNLSNNFDAVFLAKAYLLTGAVDTKLGIFVHDRGGFDFNSGVLLKVSDEIEHSLGVMPIMRTGTEEPLETTGM